MTLGGGYHHSRPIQVFNSNPSSSINNQVFRFFEGKWSIRRRFEGSYSGGFSGEAHFATDTTTELTYDYSEQGGLTDAEGQHFDAKQSYRYRFSEGILQVLKREGSDWIVMHDLDFRDEEGVATASHLHLCGQDHYATVYRVDLSGSWEVDYTVSGPKKDYRIHTDYRRTQDR
jgi:hypothetical protein